MNTRKSLTATLNGVVQVTLHTTCDTYGGTEMYPDVYKLEYIYIGRSVVFSSLSKRFDRAELQRELQKVFGCFLQLDVDDGVHTVFCTVDRDERVVLAGVVYCQDDNLQVIENCKGTRRDNMYEYKKYLRDCRIACSIVESAALDCGANSSVGLTAYTYSTVSSIHADFYNKLVAARVLMLPFFDENGRREYRTEEATAYKDDLELLVHDYTQKQILAFARYTNYDTRFDFIATVSEQFHYMLDCYVSPTEFSNNEIAVSDVVLDFDGTEHKLCKGQKVSKLMCNPLFALPVVVSGEWCDNGLQEIPIEGREAALVNARRELGKAMREFWRGYFAFAMNGTQKIAVKYCLSMNPIDIVTASTFCSFTSCYNLYDGVHNHGAISHLFDSKALISFAYCRNTSFNEVEFPRKVWRQYVYIDIVSGIVVTGRQYPVSKTVSDYSAFAATELAIEISKTFGLPTTDKESHKCYYKNGLVFKTGSNATYEDPYDTVMCVADTHPDIAVIKYGEDYPCPRCGRSESRPYNAHLITCCKRKNT